VIRARGLSRRFGDKRVLEMLDLDLEDGGFLVVTGANGSGKTTLLRLCAGLLAPTGGELRVETDRAGIGFLARKSGVPILPVGLAGTPEAKMFRSRILVNVGEPFQLNALGLPENASDQETADAIMRRVAMLLPADMRGYYADGIETPM